MASVAPEIAQALGALTTATTFSVGFLSSRVHRERGRALDRASKIDEQIMEAAKKSNDTRVATGLDSRWFEEQYEALKLVSNGALDRMGVALNVILGMSIVGLALTSGLSAKLDWSSGQGRLLITYMFVALSVVSVGTLDFYLARRETKKRWGTTAVAHLEAADRLLLRATDSGSGVIYEEARRMSESAIRASRGIYGSAWAMLGYVHLAGLRHPQIDRNDLLLASVALVRAAQIGPETAPMRAAMARAREEQGDFERAAVNWVRALWIYHEAVRPLSIDDTSAASVAEQAHASGRGVLAQSMAPASPSAWRYTPEDPRTLRIALPQIPSHTSVALMCALNLLGRVKEDTPDLDQCGEAIIGYLDDWLTAGSWRIADSMAEKLISAEPQTVLFSAIEQYRSDAGPIGRQKAEEEQRWAAFDEVTRRSDENLARMAAMAKELAAMPSEYEAVLAREQENRDRADRVQSGEASAEDIVLYNQWMDEVLAEARIAADPETRRREEIEDQRRNDALQAKLLNWERVQADTESKVSESRAVAARANRMVTGRVTEEDLARRKPIIGTRDPWPEPPNEDY